MNHHHEHTHEVGYKEPVIIFLCLVFFTLLTVGVAGKFESATSSLLIAFLIAAVKATLVVRYFMHLKYEDRLFSFFLATALGTFLVVFILLFSDYAYRW